MTFEERMRTYCGSTEDVEINEEKLRKTIQLSKAALYQGSMQNPLSQTEFLLQQFGYIRKRWWAAQAVALLILWLFLFMNGTSAYTRRCMGILAPLFVILLMPELWKSRNCGCMEVEAVSYFSVRKIYAARMLWFLMADILLLSIFFTVSVLTLKLTIGEMVIQFFLPMNVTCCICFCGLGSNRADSDYVTFGMSMAWIGIWILVVLQEKIYQAITAPVWVSAVVLSVLFCARSIYKVWKNCEQYWEVNLLWN